MIANPWITASEKEAKEVSQHEVQPENPAAPKPTAGSTFTQRFLAARRSGSVTGTGESFAERFVTERKAASEQARQNGPRAQASGGTAAAPPRLVNLRPRVSVAASEESPDEYPKVMPDHQLIERLRETRQALAEEKLPRLNRRLEHLIAGNSRELSLIEGNLLRLDRKMTSFYFTSCFDGEGKTLSALQTAYALAVLARRNVLLTDTNVSKPRICAEFGIAAKPGLQELLLDKAAPEAAIAPTIYEHLYVLPAGEGQLPLHDPRVGELLQKLGGSFDAILLDGKSVMTSSESSKIAPMIDGFLLVIECERTKWEVVQMANERLTNAGAENTAVILNKRKYYLPRIIYRMLSR